MVDFQDDIPDVEEMEPEGAPVGSSNNVVVDDGEETTIYVPGDSCYYCKSDAGVVVIAETLAGTVHHAVCGYHLEQIERRSTQVEVRQL